MLLKILDNPAAVKLTCITLAARLITGIQRETPAPAGFASCPPNSSIAFLKGSLIAFKKALEIAGPKSDTTGLPLKLVAP